MENMERRFSINGYRGIKVEPCVIQGNCKPLECKVAATFCGLPDLIRKLKTNDCREPNQPCEAISPILDSSRCHDARCERASVIFKLQKRRWNKIIKMLSYDIICRRAVSLVQRTTSLWLAVSSKERSSPKDYYPLDLSWLRLEYFKNQCFMFILLKV